MKTLAIFLLVVCITQKVVNDKVCDALCKKTHDGGYAKSEYCICWENKGKIQDFMRGRINVQEETYQDSGPPITAPRPLIDFGG